CDASSARAGLVVRQTHSNIMNSTPYRRLSAGHRRVMLLECQPMAERPVDHGIFGEDNGDVVTLKSGIDRKIGNHPEQPALLFDRPSLKEQDLDNRCVGGSPDVRKG